MSKKIRNPFKKSSAIDCAINVGIGGAANVAADYVVSMLEENLNDKKPFDADYVNIGKAVIGAVGSSMLTNKYLKSACDGIAVVGVSNFLSGMIVANGTDDNSGDGDKASGIPFQTIGSRIRTANAAYARKMRSTRRSGRVSGVAEMVD